MQNKSNGQNANTAVMEPEELVSAESKKNEASGNSFLKPRNMVILAVVLVAALAFGIYHLVIASRYVSTDDAYLTADIVQIAPQVSGTVQQVLVKENQEVKAGQLLVVLDDSTYRAAVAQKKADLDAAIAQAKGAGVSVQLAAEQGNAAITQAKGGVEQAVSGIAGARADVLRSESAVKNAAAVSKGASANVGAAESAANAAVIGKKRSAEAVEAAQAQLEAAEASVRTAQAGVEAAKASSDRAAQDEKRYNSLYSQGATSQQRLDEAHTAAVTAKAQLDSAHEQVSAAKALVSQKRAELRVARDQVESSDAAIAQAKAQLAAIREQSSAAAEGFHQAQAQREVVIESVHQAEAKRQQAEGQLQQAQTAPSQVKVSMSAKEQALARIEQARAALKTAQLQLSYTHIYAPTNGRVSKKNVQIGSLVQPGTPLMAEVSDNLPWVAANFKETQLSNIKRGNAALVYVDALPGHAFRAKVESVSPATGSTFALLPTDNATGNFTKVVQRVPVKIVLEPGQPDADRISAGMSVVAKVQKGI